MTKVSYFLIMTQCTVRETVTQNRELKSSLSYCMFTQFALSPFLPCAILKTPKMNDISLLRKRLKIVSKITLCLFHYIYSKILEILKTMTSNCTILFWLPLRIFDSSWFLITLPAWGWRTKDNRRNILLNLIEVKPFYRPVISRIAWSYQIYKYYF